MTEGHTPTDLEDRKIRERDFHNERERLRRENVRSHDHVYANRKFYSVAESSDRYMEDWLRERCPGKRILYYCCGTGNFALEIAKMGAAEVIGIDIADECIKTAQEEAVGQGLADHCKFLVMDAENTDFEDDAFDIVVAIGCLHHLDLENAYRELARVVKPDGLVLCNEALANNPLIMAYRRLTPHLRTEYEAEHILSVDQIRSSSRYFEDLDLRFFHFLVLAAVPLRNTPVLEPVLHVLERVDRILGVIPGIQNMAWQSVFVLGRPRKR